MGSGAKSYVRKGFLKKCTNIFTIYEEVVSHIWFCTRSLELNCLIYEENFLFFFISVVYPLNNIAYCWSIFLSVMLARERYLAVCYPNHHTLKKKKIKFFSYIRKFRMEQLQSHIWLTVSSYMGKYLRISSHIRKFLPNIWLCNCMLLSEFPYIWGKFTPCLRICSALCLKGQCHEIFCFRFFSWIAFPQAPDNNSRVISNFF